MSEELAVIENTFQALSVHRDPNVVLEEARVAAKALTTVIESKKKKVVFNGETYLENEDWLTVARFYGVTSRIRSTNFIEYGDVRGFEATAEAFLLGPNGGEVISSSEAMCLNDEPNWAKKPLFQLRSMAQTRASSRVLRQVFGWVVVLAGYKATPAEEMDGQASAQPRGRQSKPQQSVGDTMCSECRQVNGHHHLCKYFKGSPNVAAAPVQPTPTPAIPEPSQATVEPKQGHQRVACKVVGLQVRKAKPLRIYTFNSNEGTWDASCFHESLYPALDKASGQFAIIDISVKRKDGRDYTNVEALIELNGLPYVGSEPADAEKW